MYITRKYYLIAPFTVGQYHRLNCRCCTSYHKKCIISSKCSGSKFLCVTYNRYRMTEVIEWLHGIHIDPYTFFP